MQIQRDSDLTVGLALTQATTIIRGPPGTGKTYTGAIIIQEWLRRQRPQDRGIVGIAQTMIAAKEISNKLWKLGCLNLLWTPATTTQLRTADQEDHLEDTELLDFYHWFCASWMRWTNLLQRHGHTDWVDIISILFRKNPTPAECLRNGLGMLGSVTGKIDLGGNPRDRAISFMKKFPLFIIDKLSNSVPLVTTVYRQARPCLDGKFGKVLIDEAAQLSDLNALIPLVAQKPERLVLLGDERQLPATVVSMRATEKAYEVSLFEKLIQSRGRSQGFVRDVGAEPDVQLSVQYRMRPEIMKFSNRWFYENSIKNHPSVCSRPPIVGFNWPDHIDEHEEGQGDWNESGEWQYKKPSHERKKYPVALINTRGSEVARQSVYDFRERGAGGATTNLRDDSGGISKYNQGEAKLIGVLVRHILQKNEEEPDERIRIQAKDVGVLTGYTQQRTCIMLELEKLGVKDVEVNTVDGFQGREKDLIIYSCVRTKELGFLVEEAGTQRGSGSC